ncbi:peroxisomal sarcosine oxidase isoform X2 [Apteryx mantelli]|uniref:Peroxisomal sarcosine oxidase isoform X2 n=1 Tax=Apteryx mantelli TaxID=2696672 RepID=A0ABM4FLW6_9AVES
MAAASEPHGTRYDAIVIGAGIQGSFAAYHLAERGKDTLLLEQFLLPHSRGSSHGQSRIIRSAYPQQHYARMMPESYRLWQRLEARAGTRLYRRTGLLVLGAPGEPEFERWRRAAARRRGPVEQLDAAARRRRFPGFRPRDGGAALWDGAAGLLHADRALRAVQELFRRSGGTLRDGEKVLGIEPGALLAVSTSAGRYRAPRLVIAAGAWSSQLLAPLGLRLPLQPLRVHVCYWKEKVPGSCGLDRPFPCFLALGLPRAPHGIYGLPACEYPGLVKVCYHHGSPVDPDQRDRPAPGDRRPDVALLRRFVGCCLPGLEPEPALLETCLYTATASSWRRWWGSCCASSAWARSRPTAQRPSASAASPARSGPRCRSRAAAVPVSHRAGGCTPGVRHPGIPATLHPCTPHPSIAISQLPTSQHPCTPHHSIATSQLPTSQHPCTLHHSITASPHPATRHLSIPTSLHPHILASLHASIPAPGIPASPHCSTSASRRLAFQPPCVPAFLPCHISASRHPSCRAVPGPALLSTRSHETN